MALERSAREKRTFETAAANVSGALETSLRRDTDFVKSVRAVLSVQPNLSASGFDRWLSLLEDRQGEPAGYGALIVKSVPASELARFQAQRDSDPGVPQARRRTDRNGRAERSRRLLPAVGRQRRTSRTTPKSHGCCRATGATRTR